MRRSIETFRVRSHIVSTERDENSTLSSLKGLGTSLSAAADREALAEGCMTRRKSHPKPCATPIAFLVRQGLRFSDLRRVVGPISADQLNALAALAAGSERVGLDVVDPLLPAVRAWAQDRSA